MPSQLSTISDMPASEILVLGSDIQSEDFYQRLLYLALLVMIISDDDNYKVLHDLLQVSQEERAAWEEHPECVGCL